MIAATKVALLPLKLPYPYWTEVISMVDCIHVLILADLS